MLRIEVMRKRASKSVDERKSTDYVFGKNKTDVYSFSSYRQITMSAQPIHPMRNRT